jgi:phytoene dehydrogenase-like protein
MRDEILQGAQDMQAEGGAAAPVIVVGGGLAGLATAAYLARAGRHVRVLERAPEFGGRARTRVQSGFAFNVGPHALYRSGAGQAVLRDLGVAFQGRRPRLRGGHAVRAGRQHTLPVGGLTLLASGLLPLPAKLHIARLLAALPTMDTAAVDDLTLADWLLRQRLHPAAAAYVEALVGLTSYAREPTHASAGAALAQIARGLEGVLYLDGGWQTLVDGLAERARAAGAVLDPQAGVDAILCRSNGLFEVRTSAGRSWRASALVLAVGPRDAARLVPASAALGRMAATRRPVRAATLDVALRRLPRPHQTFALGIDRSLYLSVHSAVARLAPADGALVHVMAYLGSERASEPAAIEAELLGLLDLQQPGWRAHVVQQRFVPDLVVAHGLPLASEGGLARRPDVEVSDVPGLFVAGDWVGREGLLADASLASARTAARRVLETAAGAHGLAA